VSAPVRDPRAVNPGPATVGTRPGSLDELRRAIAARRSTVAVVGMGYVGLPLLMAASQNGFPVIGVDSDRSRVEALSNGESYVVDVASEEVAALRGARFATEPAALADADVILIAVPTPLVQGVPDLSMVVAACTGVAAVLAPGRLVILESTTYPGTTDEVVRPILEEAGLRASVDFALAYSPERVDPGSGWSLLTTPKIVGGVDVVDGDIAELFYRTLGCEVVRTATPREAEMAKLVENTFRQVNIALVNELAMLAPDLGVDIWASIDAAATKPFGYMPFWPGPGVGGHCIAIDPSYLSWRVDERRGFGIPFIEHARSVNNRMPEYVVSRIGDALNDAGKPIKGSRVLVLGLSYKAGVNDVRESPAVAVVERLAKAGASVLYHDAFVPATTILDNEATSQPLDPELLETQDCVVILTAHPDIDYAAVVHSAKLVFDARGVTRGLDAPHVVRL
jgi:UDP-N-acetyl-D-glucosamine dehydrogenase